MGRNQYSYPPEYRARMVELVRAGRTPEELGREFEPTAQSIRSWVYQANRDEGRRADGLTSTEWACPPISAALRCRASLTES